MDDYTKQDEAYRAYKRGFEDGVKSVGDKMKATDREKLYNLIHTFVFEGAEVSDMTLADHLIANGVTIPVRCKDCKQWCRNNGITDSPNGNCFYHDSTTNGYDFCSYGERKDNGM